MNQLSQAAGPIELAVVIPAYKGRHLGAALESLARQTDRRFRVYVADDGSPEDLWATVAPFRERMPLVYHRFDDNLGRDSLVSHWHRAVALGKEPWVWLFSDDDEAEPDCVAAFYATRDRGDEPEVDLFRFNLDIIDDTGNVRSRPKEHPPFESAWEQSLAIVGDRLRQWRVVDHIFSRAIFAARGGLPDFPMAFFSDSAAWIEFGTPRGVRTIPAGRVRWRHHEESLSSWFGLRHRAHLLAALQDYSRWLHHYSLRLAHHRQATLAKVACRRLLCLAGLLRPMPDRAERQQLRESLDTTWHRSTWPEFTWIMLKSYLRDKPGFRAVARWRFNRSFRPQR
ncbi:MAG TPA: glycosyltransferase family 2 protein [Opitutus sp.]|nr:glycosyltransferase family 2 protein [Opitutus sp.]